MQISRRGQGRRPARRSRNDLTVTGTPEVDVITASRNGHVNFGPDADIDIRTFKPVETVVKAGAGDDILLAGAPVPAARRARGSHV